MRQQLCPHFSGLQSPQETCSLPPQSRPCVLCSIAEFAEREEEPTLQGLVLLAKRKAGHIEIILSATHTYSSPNNNKRQELYKTTWLSDPRLLGDRESPYPVVGSTGNQPWEQLYLVYIISHPEPRGPAQTDGEVWSVRGVIPVWWMLLWFAVYRGLGQKLTMLFKEKAVTLFWQTFFFAIPPRFLVAIKGSVGYKGCIFQSQSDTAKSDLHLVLHSANSAWHIIFPDTWRVYLINVLSLLFRNLF